MHKWVSVLFLAKQLKRLGDPRVVILVEQVIHVQQVALNTLTSVVPESEHSLTDSKLSAVHVDAF